MPDNTLEKYKHKKVRIRAAGLEYVGTLLEVTDEYAFIRRQNGYSQIPMERIQSVRLADEKTPPLTPVEPQQFQFTDESDPKKKTP